jgi:hypothetical protein
MALANLIDVGRLAAIFFGLRRALRPVLRAGLRIADGLGQHLAPLSLRLRRRKARFLPLGHGHYVGTPEGEVNATGTAKSGATDISHFEDNPHPLRSA